MHLYTILISQHVTKLELAHSDGSTLTVVVVFGCVVLGDDRRMRTAGRRVALLVAGRRRR